MHPCNLVLASTTCYDVLMPKPRCRWVEDAAADFRVGAAALAHAHFAVFGCGNSEYEPAHYNVVAKKLDRQLAALGGWLLGVGLLLLVLCAATIVLGGWWFGRCQDEVVFGCGWAGDCIARLMKGMLGVGKGGAMRREGERGWGGLC